MLKIDPAQAVYSDGERAVVFKNGERVGTIRINKDDGAWLFRVAPDKASIRLSNPWRKQRAPQAICYAFPMRITMRMPRGCPGIATRKPRMSQGNFLEIGRQNQTLGILSVWCAWQVLSSCCL